MDDNIVVTDGLHNWSQRRLFYMRRWGGRKEGRNNYMGYRALRVEGGKLHQRRQAGVKGVGGKSTILGRRGWAFPPPTVLTARQKGDSPFRHFDGCLSF